MVLGLLLLSPRLVQLLRVCELGTHVLQVLVHDAETLLMLRTVVVGSHERSLYADELLVKRSVLRVCKRGD